ncbi:polysaccharide deacetylase family protein [Bacillus sp. EB600]|uniref:polysaccharide deacetylase family protein n=1 Tax=Bacillus sp. EB600 TaxID=2806345 RepID=UPI00210992CA|nr:polysaccharide deacetylase family protein [Bacillus sp. EB600]MCQ6280599.1 polysaccharide deacetylase family protein [Bacillus sp. EB600]
MSKKIGTLVILLVALFLLFFGTYDLMNSRTYQLFGGLISHVDTNKKVVALTFDDGPTNNVKKILPLLEKYSAKASFFVIGNELKKNPKLGQEIVKAGDQIGNHTFSHQRMVFKTPAYIKTEIERTDRLIRKTGYKGKIDFRPPNGKKLVALPYYLMKHHRDTITWNLEPDTYYTSISAKVDYVNQSVKPGSIILLHPMYDHTGNEIKTIEGILDTLSKKGYTFVTVNQLKTN